MKVTSKVTFLQKLCFQLQKPFPTKITDTLMLKYSIWLKDYFMAESKKNIQKIRGKKRNTAVHSLCFYFLHKILTE